MFSKQTIRNVVIDLAGNVTKQTFTQHHKHYIEGLTLHDDLGLDSIQIMELAAYTNNLFHIFETGKENYLLENDAIDSWVDKIIRARAEKNKQITFRSSGTSGNAKSITHQMDYLLREVNFLASFFKDASQIITYVPAGSIYGFLFTVLLPNALQIPVLHASEIQWNNITPKSIIVASPFHWSLLIPTIPSANFDCYGVSATSYLAPALQEEIQQKGIDLLEVYGSTETSGIGYKKKEGSFKLFPYLRFDSSNTNIAITDIDTNKNLLLQDELIINEEGDFLVSKRIDNQVNIAGKLVNLSEVTTAIETIANIEICKLIAKQFLYNTRLVASIKLLTDNPFTREMAIQQIKKSLPAHQTPVEFYFL
jgi:4-coumarate--CoA ligase